MATKTKRRRDTLAAVRRDIVSCERCPRLRDHCRAVAQTKRAMYKEHDYWGKPVPGFGDPQAGLLVVGLAPGAHGANRTGRMFTGDRSGDFLFAALHRAGFANQPEAVDRADGLEITGAYITGAARCAPPGNKPTAEELAACLPFLRRERDLLSSVRAVLALGRIGHEAYLRFLRAAHPELRMGDYPFGHGAEHDLPDTTRLFDSFHPSQQNTFTGRLTPRDMDRVLRSIRRRLESASHRAGRNFEA